MRLHRLPKLLCVGLLAATPAALCAEPPANVVFMEPRATLLGGLQKSPTYQLVTDPARRAQARGWLDNESARRALALHAQAATLVAADPAAVLPPYYIALVPEGNHADIGFRLTGPDGTTAHDSQPYIKLDPSPDAFQTTLLHETGHVVLALLGGARGIPRRELAAIPHTTSALSDRGTAFDEGFAIHLETVAAHLAEAADLRARYHRQRLEFGAPQLSRGEYFRPVSDLLSYAQNLARYTEVRDNQFAFAPACRAPDYLRVQLDKSRDFATLRDANQLLQSEGFHASFFFGYLMRGTTLPDDATLVRRYDRLLRSIRAMLADGTQDAETPYLVRLVTTCINLYPDEAPEVVDVFNDLSHGVFVAADAAALWREFYDAALRLDLERVPKDRMNTTRRQWREAVLANPDLLRTRLGPQLACTVPTQRVSLVALGRAGPLRFDLNTVEEGVIRLIPGISDEETRSWLCERQARPFADVDDFRARVPLREVVASALRL